MPKDQPKGDPSPLVELRALFPTGGRLTVKAPYDPEHPDAVREDVDIRVRALTAREIANNIEEATAIVQAVLAVGIGRAAKMHFEDACVLMSVATDVKGSWVGSLDGGDFMRFWKTFVGANADFFMEATDMVAGSTGKKLARALNIGVGLTPSSSSTEPASPTP